MGITTHSNNVWGRFKGFACKLMSLKVAGAGIATWLLLRGVIDAWMWFAIFLGAIGLSQTGRINDTIKTLKAK